MIRGSGWPLSSWCRSRCGCPRATPSTWDCAMCRTALRCPARWANHLGLHA